MVNPKFKPPFTEKQIRALIIIPRIATIPSLVGLLWIFWDVLSSKDRRNRSYHRLIFAMSVNDFCIAAMLFCSTWPVPASFPTFGAKGNDATCQGSAFLRESGSRASVLYSASLAIYFLLVIKFGWSEARLKKAEFIMHIFNNTLGWGLGIIAFPLEMYNPFFLACSIMSSPIGCTQSYEATADNPATCVRGDNAAIYQFATVWALVWASFFTMIVCLSTIYWYIYKRERGAAKYSYNSERAKDFRKSRKFAGQAFLYCFFFLISWIMLMTSSVMDQFFRTFHYLVLVIGAPLYSWQGFFNCIIYVRPRYMTYIRENPGKGLLDFLNPRRKQTQTQSSSSTNDGFLRTASFRNKLPSFRKQKNNSASSSSQQPNHGSETVSDSEDRLMQSGFFQAPVSDKQRGQQHQQQQQQREEKGKVLGREEQKDESSAPGPGPELSKVPEEESKEEVDEEDRAMEFTNLPADDSSRVELQLSQDYFD
jgi:hypothetical protein